MKTVTVSSLRTGALAVVLALLPVGFAISTPPLAATATAAPPEVTTLKGSEVAQIDVDPAQVKAIPLPRSGTYRVVVTGSWRIGANQAQADTAVKMAVDAECSLLPTEDAWQRERFGDNPAIFDLVLDHRPIAWVPTGGVGCSPNHEYETYLWVGPGRSLPVGIELPSQLPVPGVPVGSLNLRFFYVNDSIQYLETVSVSSGNKEPKALFSVPAGKDSLLMAHGTYYYSWHAKELGDAECSEWGDNATSAWAPGFAHPELPRYDDRPPGENASRDLGDLYVNRSPVDWQPAGWSGASIFPGCDKDHRYFYRSRSNGTTPSFRVEDLSLWYFDNYGELFVHHFIDIPSPSGTSNDLDDDGLANADEGVGDSDKDGDPDSLDVDSDDDGVGDRTDNCLKIANPTQADFDADSRGDVCDSDDDGDGFSDDAEGTGDSDGDGKPDSRDADSDNDGRLDQDDNCRTVANPEQTNTNRNDVPDGGDACDNDVDSDGVPTSIEGLGDADGDGTADYRDTDSDNDDDLDGSDNCRTTQNSDQADLDGDTIGDSCDEDIDGDGLRNEVEGSGDSDDDGVLDYRDPDKDHDGRSDDRDNCSGIPNPDQADVDEDRVGDACDSDIDGDGYKNNEEPAGDPDADGKQSYADKDSDGDSKPDDEDVCPWVYDPDQTDADNDHVGDACENSLPVVPARIPYIDWIPIGLPSLPIKLETLSVPTKERLGVQSATTLLPGLTYKFVVSGIYEYGYDYPNVKPALADAECAQGTTASTKDKWDRAQFGDPSRLESERIDLLDLYVDERTVTWKGPNGEKACNTIDHTYEHLMTVEAPRRVNIRIIDGGNDYTDNKGSLSVTIYQLQIQGVGRIGPLETVRIDSGQASGTPSQSLLLPGVPYVFVVRGTYQYRSYPYWDEADAECSENSTEGDITWQAVRQFISYPHSSPSNDSLDLVVGGKFQKWEPFSDSFAASTASAGPGGVTGPGCSVGHDYILVYTPPIPTPTTPTQTVGTIENGGLGLSVNFKVYDPQGAYGDNAGFLYVDIYSLASFIRPIDSVVVRSEDSDGSAAHFDLSAGKTYEFISGGIWAWNDSGGLADTECERTADGLWSPHQRVGTQGEDLGDLVFNARYVEWKPVGGIGSCASASHEYQTIYTALTTQPLRFAIADDVRDNTGALLIQILEVPISISPEMLARRID